MITEYFQVQGLSKKLPWRLGKLWGRFGKYEGNRGIQSTKFRPKDLRDILFGAATFWWFSKCCGTAPVPLMHLKWSEGTGDGWKRIGNHRWVAWSRFGPDVFHRGFVSVNWRVDTFAPSSLCVHSVDQLTISCTTERSFRVKLWACTPLFPLE